MHLKATAHLNSERFEYTTRAKKAQKQFKMLCRLQRRISLMMFLHNADSALEEYPSIIKIRPNAVGLSVSQRVFYFNFFLDF